MARSVAYAGNFENHPAAVRRLAESRSLLGNFPDTLARARDFEQLSGVVRRAGGRVPATRPSGRTAPLPAGRHWLRKPERGGGGIGVRDWRPGDLIRTGERLQERVDGRPGSVAFLADGRRAVILGLCEGLAGDPTFGASGYRYCGSLYPLEADEGLVAEMEAVAQAATRAFGLVGVNGIDFVLRDGRPFVLELNPRFSASMELIERGAHVNVFEVHAAACRGALPAHDPAPPAEVLGKAVLWARRDLVVGDTRSWLGRDDRRDIPFPGERIRRGRPICTVFAGGPDRDACYRGLAAAAASVEREIEANAEARA
jgi:predicted ATP-grasp superfamily ATP-dependent carboligase